MKTDDRPGSKPRNRQDRRAWWRAHVEAQLVCGQTQITYCRAQGLNLRALRRWMRVFTVGDGRSRRRELVPKNDTVLDLVPVVVTSSARTSEAGPDGDSISLQISLAHGIGVTMQLGTLSAAARLLRELAGPAC
jgi:hypothetical protein